MNQNKIPIEVGQLWCRAGRPDRPVRILGTEEVGGRERVFFTALTASKGTRSLSLSKFHDRYTRVMS